MTIHGRRLSWRRQLDIFNAHQLALLREEVHRLEAELAEAVKAAEFRKSLKKAREHEHD